MALTPQVTPEPAERYDSGLRMAMGQFATNRAATAGLVCFILICSAAILAPAVAPYDPTKINLGAKLMPPSLDYLLGTDHFGRDMFSRLVWGARVSLMVGVGVVAFALALGVPIGLAAGYAGGGTDNALMRLMDGFLTFPPLLLGVTVVGLLGPDLRNVMIALGIVQVPVLARIVRGATLSVSTETYVTATRALGATTTRIILRHILKNILSAIIVQMTIGFSAAIITEASLSFLGIGTQPPMPSWGRDLAEARRFIADAPWLFLAPTALITLCVLSINFIGDGLRDALDPKSWQPRRKAEPQESIQ